MNKLLIIDGHSLAYRCYHAVKNSPTGLITDADGVPITITSGFLRSLSILLAKHQPTHLAVCFDPGGKTWRHELYPEYKSTKIKNPKEQELIQIDIRNLQAILKEKAIAVVKVLNYEADDVIASICYCCASTNPESLMEIVISSADKDLLQLVDDNLKISVDYQHGKNSKVYTEKEVFEEFGVKANQIADYKALVGDESDNIPGVKGIGKISATHLLNNWNSVKAIANNLDRIKPQFAKKIKPEKDKLLLWYKLTKLKINLKFKFYLPEDFENTDLSKESAISIELGIKTTSYKLQA